MNKINIIGEALSKRLNLLFDIKELGVSDCYKSYFKMIDKNNGYDNIYQLDLKKAYDLINHQLSQCFQIH